MLSTTAYKPLVPGSDRHLRLRARHLDAALGVAFSDLKTTSPDSRVPTGVAHHVSGAVKHTNRRRKRRR
jgi:hypothetical protein